MSNVPMWCVVRKSVNNGGVHSAFCPLPGLCTARVEQYEVLRVFLSFFSRVSHLSVRLVEELFISLFGPKFNTDPSNCPLFALSPSQDVQRGKHCRNLFQRGLERGGSQAALRMEKNLAEQSHIAARSPLSPQVKLKFDHTPMRFVIKNLGLWPGHLC